TVIRTALEAARVHPETISYIETHGTGTQLGDPIEIESLKQAFNTPKRKFCAIGSVKTNIGHLDAAAGIAGFIKTVLSLKHKTLPPSLHFNTPNPKIDFPNSPFYVNNKLTEWKSSHTPLRAGVSAFGIGGTNAHVILEEAPPPPSHPQSKRSHYLLLLSAKTEAALDTMTQNLVIHLQPPPPASNPDNQVNQVNPTNQGSDHIAYTLQVGRKSFPYRQMLVVQDAGEAIHHLSDPGSPKVKRHYTPDEPRITVFMFPGQGSQYVNMGLGLYHTEPLFRNQMDRCFEILTPLMETDIKEILYPAVSDNNTGSDLSPIYHAGYSQPILFSFQYALAKVLMTWGVMPDAILGYSLGEYVAACISGVISLEDALKLVVVRGKLVENVHPGVMLNVPFGWNEVKELIEDAPISLSADNGNTCIITGTEEVISDFETRMGKKLFAAVRIPATHAIHSPLVAPVTDRFREAVGNVELNKPRIPYLSNVTGNWVTDREAMNPGYWANHMLGAVQFDKSIARLLENQRGLFIEVGPGNAICSMIRRRDDKLPGHIVTNLTRLPRENIPDPEFLLNKLGYLNICGLEIDWEAYYESANAKHRRVPLPVYPFQGKKYWFDGNPYHMIATGQTQPSASTQLPRSETTATASTRFHRPETGTPYTAPGTGTERQLARIFRDFMGAGEVGVLDNFFSLGIDSIKLMSISLKIREELNVRLPVPEYFNNPTIRELARFIDGIDGMKRETFTAIEPVEEREYYNLSDGQRRMWVLHQLDDRQTGYNMAAALDFKGNLNIDALNNAFHGLIRRHESLRTGFIAVDGIPRQIIFPCSSVNLSIEREAVAAEDLETVTRAHGAGVFDLSRPPLFRAKLLTLSPGHHIFLFTMHHIISDGWSMNLFIKELTLLYNTGPSSLLPPLLIQYKDYAHWQNKNLTSDAIRHSRSWWLEKLSGTDNSRNQIPVPDLPTDHSRPAFKTHNGDIQHYILNPGLSHGIANLAASSGVTLFMTLLAAVHLLLYRYTEQEDIIIGSPIAGRNHPGLDDQIGLYINMLPFRNRVKGTEGFHALLKQVKQTTTKAYQHQSYPFDRLVDELELERDTSRHPLFDVMIVLQNTPQEELNLEGIRISPMEDRYRFTPSNFDITFHFQEKENPGNPVENNIHLDIEYSTGLFESERIVRLWFHFTELLQSILLHPDQPVQQLNLLPENEKKLLLETFNDTYSEYPEDKTIVQLFEEQVEKRPGGIAAISNEVSISYRQLNKDSNRLADMLTSKGITNERIVALMIERSLEMLIGILGTLKAGGAYMPIDPDYPEERTNYMLRDSGAGVVVINGLVVKALGDTSDHSNRQTSKPANLAYILYTSGSTGKPKGVMIEHRNVVSYYWNLQTTFSFTPSDRVYALTTYTFDISVMELIGSLLCGSAVVIESNIEDLENIGRNVRNHAISIFQATPSRLAFLIDTLGTAFLTDVRLLFVGGEPLPRRLWDRLLELKRTGIHNIYGPSETTIWSTTKKLDNHKISIGKPLLNETVSILSPSFQLVPIGIPGQICITGAGVGRGYMNRQELTKGKFELYQTGDLGRWLPDGI
ncbi:MAG: AMP-binding protein, partial [bacterium]|nr:AMP-binding protein [bacterium]